MPDINQLREMIDLHELARRLGVERPANTSTGNYRSPHHPDNHPSLSISKDGKKFTDFSAGGDNTSGSCVDFIMYVQGIDEVSEAMRQLHELYDLDFDKPKEVAQPQKKTLVDYVAKNCLENKHRAMEYLVEKRGIDKKVVELCLKRNTVGFNTYTSKTKSKGEVGWGGDGVSFITYQAGINKVAAVDTRYLDPDINGGLKSNCQGDKWGQFWTPDPIRLDSDAIKTVVVVESPINALTVESHAGSGVAAVAIMGVKNGGHEWKRLKGKRIVLCLDNDEPVSDRGRNFGHRPGQESAWRIHEEMTALNIAALFVDLNTEEWEGVNDINDYAQMHDKDCKDTYKSHTRIALKRLDHCLIPGLSIEGAGQKDKPFFKRRVYLPDHDFKIYWRFHVQEDFTSCMKTKTDGEGHEKIVPEDVCGFRIASLSKVSVASATATMSGEKDLQPRLIFAATVQTPRHGNTLLRRVMSDEALHNVDQWRKFGPIFKPAGFARLLNVWERATSLGARDAVNFVGLCWRDGKIVINEGPDCYFTDPEKQCPYHNLTFSSGSKWNAARVLKAYQETFKDNAAAMMLTWAVGAQLKNFIGFWPHFMLQADKGAGKSTLCKRLERTIGFSMLSGQSLATEFRLLTSVSHTSHPVGWEELSARKQEVIDKAASILQECYQYSITRRGGEMTEYVLCAPVLLAGEEVPVQTLLQKLVRTDLSGKRGPLMDEDLPVFPMREWMKFLEAFDKKKIFELLANAEKYAVDSCCASSDESSHRIVKNYAVLMMTWKLLCEFSGVNVNNGNFIGSCVREMNLHITETKSEREPWIWIMETILGEIDRGRYENPFKFDDKEGELCLLIRPLHIMQHIATTPALKERWNSLPIKGARVLKKNLLRSGVVKNDNVERRINHQRVPNLIALSVEGLASYGLHPSIPVESESVTPSKAG